MTFCDLRSRLRCRRNDYGWWWRWDVWRGHWRVLCVLWSRSGLSLCSLLLHHHTGHYYEKEGAGLPGTLFFTNVRSQFWDSYSGSLSLLLPRATDG